MINKQIVDVRSSRFRTLTTSYYRGAHGVFVLFDCTSRESFHQVLQNFEEFNRAGNENIQKILVATKIDLIDQRQVSYEEAKELADQLGVPYIETSSKNNINVKEAVQILTRTVESNIERRNADLPVEPTVPTRHTWRCTVL